MEGRRGLSCLHSGRTPPLSPLVLPPPARSLRRTTGPARCAMWILYGRGIFLEFRPRLSTSLSSHVLPLFSFCLLWSGPRCASLLVLAVTSTSRLFPPPCLSQAVQSYWIRLERQVRISQPALSVSAGLCSPSLGYKQPTSRIASCMYIARQGRETREYRQWPSLDPWPWRHLLALSTVRLTHWCE